MLDGHHYQIAYVTRDIEEAAVRLAPEIGARDIHIRETSFPAITPTGSGTAVLKLALIWVDEVQYELIQPVKGPVEIYADLLPQDNALRFHHIAIRVDDWDSFRKEVDRRSLNVVLEGGNEALKFLYLDRRDLLGHHVEYVWATHDRWAVMGAPWAQVRGDAFSRTSGAEQ